jgi:indole-3-glycerol phosphate synthase
LILDQIVRDKKYELEARKKELPFDLLKEKIKDALPARDFKAALLSKEINLITEIKKASPSGGIIREDFNPIEIANIYQNEGASAISVLTERKYFEGNLDYLRKVKAEISIPVLRKDFIFDPYQICESKVYGADAVLLIAAILKLNDLKKLLSLTYELGMDALVEVHTRDELQKALDADADIVGINNRNLDTLEIDLKTTEELAKLIPSDKIIVSESGIKTREDIERLKKAGARAFLVGESLMRSQDIGAKMRELME